MDKEKKTVSILVEQDTFEKLTQLQKETGVFSRSKLLRDIIDKGLEVYKKA